MAPIFRGEIHGGAIKLEHRGAFAAHVATLEGKRVELVLRKHKAKRSLSQNALYWSAYVPVFMELMGYDDPDECHEALKWRFLRIHEDREYPSVRSTASLSTAEFTEYLDKLARVAAEHGYQISTTGQV